ncbi:MAG TPA: PEP-CTERM sorting domain-containing protein [Pseudoduganella sp.]
MPLSFGGSFGRTAYNYGDTTLRLRWETKAAIDNSWLQPAPVPEPASWAMLLGGLTVLGTAGARRRRERRMLASCSPASPPTPCCCCTWRSSCSPLSEPC